MSVPVDELSPAAVVHLVNGWGSTPRREAGEEDRPFPAADRLVEELGPGAAPLSDERLVDVADRLHPVFAAAGVADRAALVTALLAGSGVRPAMRAENGSVRDSWLVDDAEQVVLAAAAVALRAHLASSPDRLGTCAGDRCADVYVDASPTGQRRFCSVTCQNRARVAAFRRRRRAPG